MPLLFVLLIVVFVNFPSAALAQENTTKIRGPRSSDIPPAPLTLGPLSPSDTLWRVAERVKPDANVSLYQVMYALFLKNPDAFLDNNLNHLRPGAILILPSLQDIQQVDINIARQKSEQDDKDWAERQKAAAAAKTAAKAAKPAEPVKIDPQWQAELEQLGKQQRQDLDGLRTQFADSLQQIEAIVDENLQLRTNLLKIEQELSLIKAQLGDDSKMQLQIEQLLAQQSELLQAKAAQDEAAALAEQSNWLAWFKHPLAWILAACIPALLVLFSILLWVKKRGKHTEEVIHAAATEPASDPTYHSPLPPLDDSNDLDESLFEIDDALLEDAFSDSIDTTEPDLSDDMLDFDDSLTFEDDSLLPPEVPTAASSEPEIDEEFDPDNILSDTDLSALLAAEDDDDAIIELADDSDEIDDKDDADARSEKPDWPDAASAIDDQPDSDSDLINDSLAQDEEFDIDELIEEIDLDEPTEQAISTPSLQEEHLKQALSQQQTLPDNEELVTEPEVANDDTRFDSSELEEFAESLAAESNGNMQQSSDEADNDDEALLTAELSELLDQVADEPAATTSNNDIENDVIALDDGIDSATHDELDIALEQDAELVVDDDFDTALADEMEPVSDVDIDLVLADEDRNADSGPDLDVSDLDESDLVESDETLLADVSESEQDDTALTGLDLTASDDESVTRPTEAALSVENPSKILEQYPELELTDDKPDPDVESDLLDMPELDADLLLRDLDDEQTEGVNTDETPEVELDPIPDAHFDSLMSELEAMADNIEAAEQQEQSETQAAAKQNVTTEPDKAHDFTDDDFVEIDSLLTNAQQQEEDPERFNQLNVDVGLEDYADIIGEHERRDVDTEDNGFSAKLDLVRAYIEIDDRESADLLLDDILASDAPEHVKKEAQGLRQ